MISQLRNPEITTLGENAEGKGRDEFISEGNKLRVQGEGSKKRLISNEHPLKDASALGRLKHDRCRALASRHH